MVNVIAIFILLLVMGLSINTLKAAENYNSSKSNTVTSIAKVHEHVGNILLPYGVGGLEINRVNDALDVGITKNNLTVILTDILGNVGLGTASGEGVSDRVRAILLEFDKIGIGEDIPQSAIGTVIEVNPPKTSDASTPGAGGAVPSPSADGIIKELLPSGISPSKRTEPAPATAPQQPSAGTDRRGFKEISGIESETRSGAFIKLGDLPGKRAAFGDSTMKSIQDLKAAESKERREEIKKELVASRQTLQESVETLRQNLRENAQAIRENFRENVKTTIGHVDHGKTARIAVAHGKGLRMVNRYRSAIARFDHILGRMESRVQKLEERGADVSSMTALIEEAKNTQVLNKAKLAELEVKYESMLTGKNPGEIAEEARAIAKELKSEIEKLHAVLLGIPTVRLEINLR